MDYISFSICAMRGLDGREAGVGAAAADASGRFLGTCRMPHVTCNPSSINCQTPHVTRHTSHVTRHTSHVTRHTSNASPCARTLHPNLPADSMQPCCCALQHRHVRDCRGIATG